MLNETKVGGGNAHQEKSDEKPDSCCEKDLRDAVVDPFENFLFEQDVAPTAINSDQQQQQDLRNILESSDVAAALVAPAQEEASSKDDENKADDDSSALARMKDWDRRLRMRVRESHPLSVSAASVSKSTDTFVYEIEDGVNGIALSTKGGIGFAQVDLVLVRKCEMVQQASEQSTTTVTTTTEKRTVLLKTMLRFRLGKGHDGSSHKLSSVEWTVVRDCCGLLRPPPVAVSKATSASDSESVRALALALTAVTSSENNNGASTTEATTGSPDPRSTSEILAAAIRQLSATCKEKGINKIPEVVYYSSSSSSSS